MGREKVKETMRRGGEQEKTGRLEEDEAKEEMKLKRRKEQWGLRGRTTSRKTKRRKRTTKDEEF